MLLKISGLIKKSESKSKYTLRKIEKNLQLSGICVLSCSDEAVACRLRCPWNSPGENTGTSCHFLLQGEWQQKQL